MQFATAYKHQLACGSSNQSHLHLVSSICCQYCCRSSTRLTGSSHAETAPTHHADVHCISSNLAGFLLQLQGSKQPSRRALRASLTCLCMTNTKTCSLDPDCAETQLLFSCSTCVDCPAAPKKRAALAAKQKSTEDTADLLVHDEEEAFFSEPDPVTTSGLTTPLASKVDIAELKQVFLLPHEASALCTVCRK